MKALLIDDHALIREALRGVLKELRDDIVSVEASNSAQAMQLLADAGDVVLVLLDLNLPDRNGLDVLAELRKRYPAVATVVLSAFNDRDNVVRALELGAVGFIPKSSTREVMQSALRLVFAGGVYIPPDILPPRDDSKLPDKSRSAQSRAHSPRDLGLTERQVEVLSLMMEGKSNKLICRALGLAEPTVKNHVTAILKALNVENRTEAVVAVAALGWDLRPASGS